MSQPVQALASFALHPPPTCINLTPAFGWEKDEPMLHPLVFAAAQIDLDQIGHRNLPDLAVELLIAGSDSPSLRLLAGESPASPGEELEELLVATLNELGLTRLDVVSAALVVRGRIAGRVVDGSLGAQEGAQRLWALQNSLENQLNDPRQAAELLGGSEVIESPRKFESVHRSLVARFAEMLDEEPV